MSSHGASTSKSAEELSEIIQINDSLYELYKPPGTPRLQILFFHGLQLDNYSHAHVSTWKSADASCVWPQKWLVEEFPDAHVLTVSYSGAIEKSSQVNMDMFNVGENLVSDLLQYNIGQVPHCPVVLVGHSLGGIVIKEVLRQAHHRLDSLRQGLPRDKLQKFLDSVRGVFFYATPHHGSEYAKTLANNINGPLLTFFRTLSTEAARLNQKFNELCRLHESWQLANLGETLPTRLPKILGLSEEVLIVPEASARGDNFNVVNGVDHFSISKPRGRNCKSFYRLKDFLVEIDNAMKDVHQCQGLPHYPIGLEKRVAEVQEKLRDAQVLGIVGMGGIGKTTLAKQLFNSISRQFQYTCFVDNVKGVDIYKLEESLFESFSENGRKIDATRTTWLDLKEKLKRNKTLIVMDDCDSEEQLNVLSELESDAGSSRLIVTTRNEDIFNFSFKNCNLYRVDLLEANPAKELFCKYARLEEILESPPGNDQLKKNVNVMVEKCGGLPLTLEILGCHLRGHADDPTYWEQTIDKLGKGEPIRGGRNDRVLDTLKVSYDSLARKEQRMFIEAALHFFGQPLEKALAAWNGAYRNAETSWENLMSRSMVKVLSDENYDGTERLDVWVHEQLHDLAASLVKSDKLWRIFARGPDEVNRTVDSLNANAEVHANTQILYLWHDGFNAGPRPIIQFDSLGKLRKLKYLDFCNIRPGDSFQNFPKKLSVLIWEAPDKFRNTSVFPPIRPNELSNLAVLDLENWKVSKEFPEALGKLINLRTLSLGEMRGFDHLPENFGNRLSQLKQLKLWNLDLRRLPASLGSLVALEELYLRLPQLKRLPDSISRLQALKKFDFCCEVLETLPDSLGLLTSLERLEVMGSPELRRLPDSLGELPRLMYLDLQVSGMRALPESFAHLSSLRTLILHSENLEELSFTDLLIESDSLESLPDIQNPTISSNVPENQPDSLGYPSSLKTLELNATSLVRIPESFGRLSSLTELTIKSESLRNLPASFVQLSALQTLELACGNLEKLPDTFGDLCSLETLELKARSLLNIPESIGGLSSLRKLIIESESLKTLPASFGHLSALQTLELTCDILEKLPDTFGALCSWERLELKARSLVNIPESIGGLSSLTYLIIESESLRNLPASLGHLSALQTLKLTCDNLEKLPDTFGDLCSLERLELKARSLVDIPESIGGLSSLRKLIIESESLRNLPASFGHLSAMQTFQLTCDNLEKLPAKFGDLCSLETLKLKARSLVDIPESIGGLSSLIELVIESESLRNLPASFGQLSALRRLSIECDSLETLPDGLGNLSSLEKLVISARSLVSIPESVGQLSSLQHLGIKADSIRNLPSSIGELPAVRTIDIDCTHLEKLPDSVGDLSSARVLYIRENSLITFGESLDQLSSLGWVLGSGERFSPPRGESKLFVKCLPFPCLTREPTVARSHERLRYNRTLT